MTLTETLSNLLKVSKKTKNAEDQNSHKDSTESLTALTNIHDKTGLQKLLESKELQTGIQWTYFVHCRSCIPQN